MFAHYLRIKSIRIFIFWLFLSSPYLFCCWRIQKYFNSRWMDVATIDRILNDYDCHFMPLGGWTMSICNNHKAMTHIRRSFVHDVRCVRLFFSGCFFLWIERNYLPGKNTTWAICDNNQNVFIFFSVHRVARVYVSFVDF